jgi:PAS domain S-box-containing protein
VHVGTIQSSNLPGSAEVNETLAAWRNSDAHAHVVHFYENDAFLVEEVSRFLGTALGAGDAAIVIATKAHREAFAQKLKSRGLDTGVAVAQGRYIALDAAETLAKFMIDGRPDAERFTSLIGAVVARANKAAGGDPPRVAAFGEMVALLWAEGKHDAAVQLEKLWNNLAEAHSFSLRCAYPLEGFRSTDHGGHFLKVCAEHSSVLPAESYMDLVTEEERRRAVAHLQQKAQALESEVALRHSEEQFRLLVEGVQDYAIFSLDTNGVVTSWNTGAERIKGYRAEEIVGQHFSRFYTEEDVRRGLPAQVLKAARESGHYEAEGWRVRKDGTRFWCNLVITAVRNREGQLIGFSKITRDITEKKALQDQIQRHTEDLERAQESLRRLSGRLLQVQDDERRRLARELHDSAGQMLAALNMNLESLQDTIRTKLTPDLAQRLAESIRLTTQVMKETRTLSYLLHPPLLDEAGLRDALHWFVGGFIERSGIKTELEISEELPRLSHDLEIAVFRIIQEGLTNIHRHSGSSTAGIRLQMAPDEILLTITDQGKGLPASPASEQANGKGQARGKTGVGLAGMRERVLQLGGRFEIVANNPGTAVKAVFPLTVPD